MRNAVHTLQRIRACVSVSVCVCVCRKRTMYGVGHQFPRHFLLCIRRDHIALFVHYYLTHIQLNSTVVEWISHERTSNPNNSSLCDANRKRARTYAFAVCVLQDYISTENFERVRILLMSVYFYGHIKVATRALRELNDCYQMRVITSRRRITAPPHTAPRTPTCAEGLQNNRPDASRIRHWVTRISHCCE